MKRLCLVLALLALLPLRAFAAEGDEQTSRNWGIPGAWKMRSFILCENRDADDTTCNEFDLQAKLGSMLGRAGWFVIAIDTTNKNGTTVCTGDMAIRNYSVSGGGAGNNFKPTIQTLTIGTTEFVRFDGPLRRFLDLNITNVTGCTVAGGGNNNLEVTLEVYTRP